MITSVPLTTPAEAAPPQAQMPQTLEEILRKRKLAEALMNEGTSYAPVGHWTQALARVANAAVGGMNAEAARRDQQGMNQSAAEALLGLYQGGQNAMPGTGSVASTPPAPQAQASPLPGPTAATPGLLADDVAGPRMAGLSGMAQNLLPEQQAQPHGMMGLGGPLPPDLVQSVKQSEGFAPRAQWDYKQHTNGYGTRAKMPGEVIDQAEAETRLNSELGKAALMVQQFAPDAPMGVKKALASLTYNAGPGWMNSGLGQAVKAGNWKEAEQRFRQYVKAGGQTLPGLVDRRNREAAWFNEQGQQPAQVADSSGQFVDRATLKRLLENPQTQEMGQKLLMQDMQRRQPLSAADQAELELKRAQIDALKAKSAGGGDNRRQTLLDNGIDPNSAEGKAFILNGKLPAAGYTTMAQNKLKLGASDKIAAGLNNLNQMTNQYDDASFENSVGPFQGSTPDGLLSSLPINAARLGGELANWWEGGKSAPSEVRSNIQGSTEAIAAAIKPLIRAPGEGVWTDADQARLVAVVGDLSQAGSKEEFKRRLNAVRDRLKANFNLDIPFDAFGEPPAAKQGFKYLGTQ